MASETVPTQLPFKKIGIKIHTPRSDTVKLPELWKSLVNPDPPNEPVFNNEMEVVFFAEVNNMIRYKPKYSGGSDLDAVIVELILSYDCDMNAIHGEHGYEYKVRQAVENNIRIPRFRPTEKPKVITIVSRQGLFDFDIGCEAEEPSNPPAEK